MTERQARLTTLLHTANLWSSDQRGHGLALLSLCTTRTVHDEEHRSELLKEIDQCIHYVSQDRATGVAGGKRHYTDNDGRRLRQLHDEVRKAELKKEWLSYDDYFRFNESLYSQGVI